MCRAATGWQRPMGAARGVESLARAFSESLLLCEVNSPLLTFIYESWHGLTQNQKAVTDSSGSI